MSDPHISAIICTHNRAAYVGAAIDSLLAQDFAGEFEIIVVDNASTDRTYEVVAARLPNARLRYVFEPITGLSIARNTGATHARSPILAYLDDDAIASPQWLRVLHEAYQRNERLAIAGGRVTLAWEMGIAPPDWLSPELASSLGAYDLGKGVTYITKPGDTPRGVNYSIRRSFLEEIGGFSVHLGRVGTNLLSNEELLVTELALHRGWQVAYLPDAHVTHTVVAERLQRTWFLKRSWWQGISEYHRDRLLGRSTLQQVRASLERLLRGLYRTVKHHNDPAQRFYSFVYAYGQLGYLIAIVQGLLPTLNSNTDITPSSHHPVNESNST